MESSGLKFRKSEVKDFDEIYSLYKMTIDSEAGAICLWDDDYPSKQLISEDIASGGGYCLEDADGIAAACYAGRRFPVEITSWKYSPKNPAYFARLVVHPSRSGKGVGKLLVQHILAELKRLGFDGVRGFVVQQNKVALKLYAAFGFEITHISDAFDDGVKLFVHEYNYPKQ